jgi:hypothetical protein
VIVGVWGKYGGKGNTARVLVRGGGGRKERDSWEDVHSDGGMTW